MAGNKKIFDLPLRTGVTSDDRLAIVDSGNTTTYSIKVSDLQDGTGVNSLESLTGDITFSGTNIDISTSGQTIVLSGSTGGGGGANYWTGVTTGTTDNLISDFSTLDAAFTTNTIATDGTGDDSLVLGWGNSTITNNGSVFVGNNIAGTGVCIGSDLSNNTLNSVNIGQNNIGLKADVTIGSGISHTGNNPNAISIGRNTQALTFRGIAIGTYSTNSASLGMVVGYQSTNSSANGSVIGAQNDASGGSGAVIMGGTGNDITSSGNYNTIVGGTGNQITGSVSGATLVGLSSYTSAATNDSVYVPALILTNYASYNFADDSAAATGGVPLGGIYHTSGALKVRTT